MIRGTADTLWQCLRRKGKPYRQRLTAETRGRINDRVSIHERPCIVEERSRIWNREADTVIGQHHKQAIVTLVERKTGLLKMKRVGHKTAQRIIRGNDRTLSASEVAG